MFVPNFSIYATTGLEKLNNLPEIPGYGFDIACFPVKVHKASAGWARAVAIFNN
jgi:kynurenine formamidase